MLLLKVKKVNLPSACYEDIQGAVGYPGIFVGGGGSTNSVEDRG